MSARAMEAYELADMIVHLVEWAETFESCGMTREAEHLLTQADGFTELLDLRLAFRGHLDQEMWEVVG